MSLTRYLEEVSLSALHFKLLLVGMLAYLFAAMDTVLIAPALDLISKELGLNPFYTGLLITSFYIGMFIGAFTCGYLSDRVGRKKMMLITTIIHALFTALFSLAKDFNTAFIIRLIAGYGAGGLLPLPGVYVAEFTPARYRGRFLGLVETSWVFGALIASGLSLSIIPNYGWRTLFYAGLIPLAIVPAILSTPESVRYLEKRRRHAEAVKVLRLFGIKEVSETISREGEGKKAKLSDLFSKNYRSRTIVLWTLWFVLVYTYHGIFIWLKKFFTASGLIPNPLLYYFIVTSFQIPGYLIATMLLDKVGRKKVLFIFLILSGLGCLGFSLANDFISILVTSSIISFFNLGAWAALYTYTPELYPTEIRATGSGSAASCGRFGGILQGPITGAVLMFGGLSATFL
ncbi:MAG TPA: MFS transporter, partial [Nitrososphaeria archaeon]|nr:MFS transporter [Nitrososphaeria archaeon]